MTDVVFRTDVDLDYVDLTACSNRGENFIEAYTALELEAVDLGRIQLPLDGLYAFRVRAREAGLTLTDGGVIA